MDTSPEFIKMCERATKELRLHLKHDIGDLFYSKGAKKVVLLCDKVSNGTKKITLTTFFAVPLVTTGLVPRISLKLKDVWLPRQDQLQAMVIDEHDTDKPMLLLSTFFTKLFSMSAEFIENAKTMEQLWLAYVMLKKFNKVWSGSDWEATCPTQ